MWPTTKVDPHRRGLLLAGLLAGAPVAHGLPRRTLEFPRDHGAHPDFATEWWYLTGHVRAGGRSYGFQLTFFRSRVASTQAMASRLAARQLLMAHAALTDVDARTLRHDQRAARQGADAVASEADTALRLRDWSLQRQGNGYLARLQATGFALDLQLTTTQPLLLQGEQGLSRKGPAPEQASYYYSQPQLAVSGRIAVDGRWLDANGRAWLDHEWSQALLHPLAHGWDWLGINLEDGGAVTAFQIRAADGQALWGGGSFRAAGKPAYVFSPGEVQFKARRSWKSALSKASYPVEWMVRTAADVYTVRALVDNQELDSRASTGTIYWEGLSDLFDSQDRRVGRGYLEMTGYASPLRLQG